MLGKRNLTVLLLFLLVNILKYSLCCLCLNREDNSLQSPDACRIHGHLYVNKVAGNFHITVGKYVLFNS